MLSSRRGFTLVEVVIAILLIDVALLALVGATALLVRQTTDTRARSKALRAATTRLESLGNAPCTSSAGVASDLSGLREEWTTSVLTNRVRDIRDSVTFPAGGRSRHIVLRTRQPC